MQRPRGTDNSVDDVLIEGYEPLIPPQILQMDYPMSAGSAKAVTDSRKEIEQILNKQDDRVLVIVGPCSIHDPAAAVEYAKLLKEQAEKYKDELEIVMRVYFEKPRTTVGWKGLINDPDLNEGYNINKGLRIARKLLLDITEMGVPVGSELLDTISPQFLGDLISWGAIGARTTESQLHRELVSGVSFPVGFKNGTNGNAAIAMEAIEAANHPHVFLGITKQGLAAITRTKGNKHCHLILRGGGGEPNYSAEHIAGYAKQMTSHFGAANIMVDFSHGNSLKIHTNQPLVCQDVAQQIAGGCSSIIGVMIESNINEGRQSIPAPDADGVVEGLKYGVSVTDACVSWEQTLPMFEMLADAVRKRRQTSL
ncbi:Phospho-2-dehydro-3-deoxyheptonate aldolase, tyrosine-inhibited [Zancudomyces culisetae]|uniref:Phospho-2-dehydro-3-deoxyheptonate aldolase n=1 Tax=Zancudomyces culisetae TaxID=1213189 RepID=A0A1R1PRG5_ZANCU|nr:Phospho-2-dehydro-3-deoxyheptonate aldolase, tyrosine-inhibited [Zancudomyces culisetae]|eukprot:OMH83539.1 Phospho-2-dehydro-3-deoxyheptonate aldolase, tyrosine-inhibited [Zancudomyces culisetae]